jgi:hypothetical protein
MQKEVGKMRRILLLVVVALMLAMVGTPAAAAPPTHAAGTITWVWFAFDEPRPAGPNAFLTGSEGSEWTGTFEGTAVDTFKAVALVNGTVGGQFWLTLTGAVGDAEGTLRMRITLWERPDFSGGRWIILGGTGELAGFRGQGTWTITGGTETEVSADYTGQILAP